MRDNIILIWMPGSGKTTLAKYLWWTIQYPVIDIDDYMEEVLWISVWDILKWLWEEEFLEFEKNITMKLRPHNAIISCSGSIPLKKETMDYLRTIGYSILIDPPIKTIKERMKSMKVDRIVWMATGHMSIDEVLDYRNKFYNESYDFVFKNDWKWDKQEMFSKFFKFFMELPFVEDLKLNTNLGTMRVIYENYENIKWKISGNKRSEKLIRMNNGCL